MRLCLFEDRTELLEPLSLTRPVFDLRCGLTTLAEKQRRAFAGLELGVLIRTSLEEVFRQENPNVAINDSAWLRQDDVLLVNGRWLAPDDSPLATWGRGAGGEGACIGVVGDSIAWAVLKKSQVAALSFDDLPERLHQCSHAAPVRQAGGRMIHYPWDLVEQNAEEIRRDFCWLPPNPGTAVPGLVGPLGDLWIAPTAKVEPMVVADTTSGPVVIDEGAVVTAFTRLEGPCYIGPGTQVLGAKIRAGTSLGPNCRIGGEVEASIMHGYSNKYHEGFLGHSYVGEWVNLGAGTHNSDLRNDYGEVVMVMHGESVPTGMSKVGCFLGDHTKTGLGTLLNTGTNVGAFCNLLPAGRFAPKYVPSFTSWWNGSLREAFTLDELLTTAEIAMKRRGVTLTAAHKALYGGLLGETAEERRRVVRENEARQLRKSA